MKNVYRSLFLLIAGASQRAFARRQIKYLKVANEILAGQAAERTDVKSKVPWRTYERLSSDKAEQINGGKRSSLLFIGLLGRCKR